MLACMEERLRTTCDYHRFKCEIAGNTYNWRIVRCINVSLIELPGDLNASSSLRVANGMYSEREDGKQVTNPNATESNEISCTYVIHISVQCESQCDYIYADGARQ